MKTVTAPTLNTITNDYHNEVGTVLHGEWNLNRYYKTLVDNTPSDDDVAYDVELFPIESIAKADRPTSGINKAVVGQAVVSADYHTAVPSARYYTADRDDEYKYWQSPVSSAASTPFAIADCAPQVLYYEEDGTTPRLVTANKISFTVENTFAHSTVYNVQVKDTTGGEWVTVASDIAIPANGKVELWWTGSAWSTTKTLTSTKTVHAVRLVVTNMNKSAYFNLIELGFRLELDLTADVATWSDNMTIGEHDFITPVGNVSSNTGSITFMNDAGTYSNDNPSSILYGLLDRGVVFTCWTKYGSELIIEFVLNSDYWTESEGETTVTLADQSKLFQEIKPRAVLWQHIPVQEAIWRLCDICGFNNYEVGTIDTAPYSMLDIFWTDGEKTAWEIFGELSRGTQTAIYFDPNGVLQIKTRESAFREDEPVYDFIKDTVPGGQPSNIVVLTEEGQYEPNKIIVNWTPAGFSEQRDNIVPVEVVWEPEGAVVIRATELSKELLIGGDVITMPTKEGSTWPYKGIIQLQGEFITYEGKKYVYYNNTTRELAWVKSLEEQESLDAKADPLWKHRNHYTGEFNITERGAWNTEEKDHTIDIAGWTKSRQKGSGVITTPSPGIRLNAGQSTVTIAGNRRLKPSHYTYLWRGNSIDVGYKYMGFSMKIDETGHREKSGGMFFAADGGLGSGYYLDIMATARMNGEQRGKRNEVVFYSMKADGTTKRFGGSEIRVRNKGNGANGLHKENVGARLAVPQTKWINFDIWFKKGGAGENDVITVWANGKRLLTANVDGTWKHSNVSRFGLFARGNSSVTFEYIYGIWNNVGEPLDGESWYDRITGGYVGDQWLEDWVYETRRVKKKIRKKRKWVTQLYEQRFFEEFGPICHEVREMDVKFTSETPVIESRIYLSNNSQVVCTEYTGDNNRAKFTLANISRVNAIISGEDELTAGGQGTINHKLFVYGRPVLLKDTQKIEREDEWAVRRRGLIEIEYESKWTQNEAAATALADWLVTRWPRSDSRVTTEVFGNPLVELGDIVHVTYNDIDADYYIVGISNSFEQGLSTNLELRRVA